MLGILCGTVNPACQKQRGRDVRCMDDQFSLSVALTSVHGWRADGHDNGMSRPSRSFQHLFTNSRWQLYLTSEWPFRPNDQTDISKGTVSYNVSLYMPIRHTLPPPSSPEFDTGHREGARDATKWLPNVKMMTRSLWHRVASMYHDRQDAMVEVLE